jgi:hypothetical protein
MKENVSMDETGTSEKIWGGGRWLLVGGEANQWGLRERFRGTSMLDPRASACNGSTLNSYVVLVLHDLMASSF